MELTVGDIIRWEDFPFPKHTPKEIKTRWFLCLGKTGALENECYFFLVAGTTQLHHYEQGGDRCTHNYVKLPERTANLPRTTVFDLTGSLYTNITEKMIYTYKSKIQTVGKLPEDRLRQFYKLMINEKRISKKIKQDIHLSFNNCGITGLKRP